MRSNVVSLVGRPNTGKHALFNNIANKRAVPAVHQGQFAQNLNFQLKGLSPHAEDAHA